LIHAWNALPAVLRDEYPLVLAGSDSEAFRELAKASNAAAITPGFVEDADLATLYRGATVFCFPSLYEGFGLPPLEAMACGTPVVASNATSLPEVLGDAAMLVDPVDDGAWPAALVRVLQDEELRRQLVVRGRARAGRYTKERSAALMLASILDAAAENGDDRGLGAVGRAS
jgi:alpha-1,3-rhamnosyl/mannosyltransferase